jgi:K+-sensing histidine kinase KdpD
MFLQILEICESPVETHVRFLSNLVDFARLEAGKYEFARTPFRLRDCLGSVKTYRLSAHQKQLELCYEVQRMCLSESLVIQRDCSSAG